MSVTSVRAEELRIAAKLTVSRREVSCGEVYVYGISITVKRNMCSVNGKQEPKDAFCRKKLMVY